MTEPAATTERAAAPAATPPGARRGRWISTSGLIGLGIAFFLPQVQSCSTAWVPAKMIYEDPAEPFAYVVHIPFLFAFAMLALLVVRLFLRREPGRRVLSHVACALTLVALRAGDFFYGWSGLDASEEFWTGWPLAVLVAVGVSTLTLLAVWLAAPAAFRIPVCLAIAGTCSLVYFLGFVEGALYGLYVSITSSALMLLGGAIELLSLWRNRRRRGPDGVPIGRP